MHTLFPMVAINNVSLRMHRTELWIYESELVTLSAHVGSPTSLLRYSSSFCQHPTHLSPLHSWTVCTPCGWVWCSYRYALWKPCKKHLLIQWNITQCIETSLSEIKHGSMQWSVTWCIEAFLNVHCNEMSLDVTKQYLMQWNISRCKEISINLAWYSTNWNLAKHHLIQSSINQSFPDWLTFFNRSIFSQSAMSACKYVTVYA